MTRGPRTPVIVEASETGLGVVQLAVIGDDTPRLATQANDPRLVQSGTAFPTDFMSVRDGTCFARTDLGGELFQWDDANSKWLSVRTEPAVFTNQNTVNAGNPLRLYQGPNGTALVGYELPWDATLVEAVAWKDNIIGGAAASLDVYAGSTLKYGLVMVDTANTGVATGLSVDFADGDKVNVKVSVDPLTNGGGIKLSFKRRAT